VHALEREDGSSVTRKLNRAQMFEFFSRAAPCRVGMEACGSAHYWARELRAMGHAVVLIPPTYVKPYVKRGKNDAADAAAICEAMSRPEMRFVPIKSADQQAVLMLHKTRELLIKQRTMSVNALRGHLLEFGLVAVKGRSGVEGLIALALEDGELPQEARDAVRLLASHLEGLDAKIDAVEATIAKASAQNPICRLLDAVPGVGPLIASAIAASVPDPGVFRSGRDFAAFLGLTPSQDSTGGKTKLGPITKKGDRYLRKSLVIGCTATLRVAHKRKGSLAEWIARLRTKKSERDLSVALANKLARICWAIMSTGEAFRAEIYAKA